MLKQQANVAAIYKRLSRDDGGDAESNSIVTQGQMLQRYAKEHGFVVYDEYTDDGVSGTTFERDDFKRMIRDIEGGKVGIVLCKDLSRLGRNNAMVAYYTEIFFPDNDVRFIAVSDAIDTFNGDNEIMPFKSVVNEYYAKDISRKVRSAYRTKALNGEFTAAYAPYGYKKDPENKHQLIVDENVSGIVQRIFQLAADGLSPYKIARQLSSEKILTPRAYVAEEYGKYKECFHPKYPTDWNHGTIVTILQNREYLGHFVGNKSTTKSFKNRKLVKNPKEQWIEVPNTHQPLIDQYVFDMAQKETKTKTREKPAYDNIFAGLLRCSDCGRALGYVKGKTEGHQGAYNCNLYRQKATRYCTAHYITHKALYQVVLDDILRNAQIAKQYEDELSEYALKVASGNVNNKYKRVQKELEKHKQRSDELDTIVMKLFEKNALGVITDEQFLSMSDKYKKEQNDVKAKIAEISAQLDKRETEGSNTMKFLNAVRKYSEITELTAGILNDLIDSIVVYDAEGKCMKKNRIQRVEINYKFIGLMQMDNEKSA